MAVTARTLFAQYLRLRTGMPCSFSVRYTEYGFLHYHMPFSSAAIVICHAPRRRTILFDERYVECAGESATRADVYNSFARRRRCLRIPKALSPQTMPLQYVHSAWRRRACRAESASARPPFLLLPARRARARRATPHAIKRYARQWRVRVP